jgi:hypothetical protein
METTKPDFKYVWGDMKPLVSTEIELDEVGQAELKVLSKQLNRTEEELVREIIQRIVCSAHVLDITNSNSVNIDTKDNAIIPSVIVKDGKAIGYIIGAN